MAKRFPRFIHVIFCVHVIYESLQLQSFIYKHVHVPYIYAMILMISKHDYHNALQPSIFSVMIIYIKFLTSIDRMLKLYQHKLCNRALYSGQCQYTTVRHVDK